MKRWIFIGVLLVSCFCLVYSVTSAAGQLELARADFQKTQTELATATAELDSAKGLWDATRNELLSAQKVLDLAKNELAATKNSLGAIRTELNNALNGFNTKVAELQVAREELGRQRMEMAALQTSYQGLMSGRGYTVKDPTFQQVLDFMKVDVTSDKTYIAGRYECRHFATEVCNNADAKGLRCAYVSLGYPEDRGHAIVGFNTIDKGMVYFEPQSDEEVKLEMGKRYYQCVIPSGNYHYAPPSYDDTVTEILVAW